MCFLRWHAATFRAVPPTTNPNHLLALPCPPAITLASHRPYKTPAPAFSPLSFSIPSDIHSSPTPAPSLPSTTPSTLTKQQPTTNHGSYQAGKYFLLINYFFSSSRRDPVSYRDRATFPHGRVALPGRVSLDLRCLTMFANAFLRHRPLASPPEERPPASPSATRLPARPPPLPEVVSLPRFPPHRRTQSSDLFSSQEAPPLQARNRRSP